MTDYAETIERSIADLNRNAIFIKSMFDARCLCPTALRDAYDDLAGTFTELSATLSTMIATNDTEYLVWADYAREHVRNTLHVIDAVLCPGNSK